MSREKKWAQKSSKSATRNELSHPLPRLSTTPFLEYLNSVYIIVTSRVLHRFLLLYFFFFFSWFLLPHEIGTTVILADFELSNVTCDLDDARDYYTGEEGLHETWMCYLVFLIRLLYYSFEKRTMHDARVFFYCLISFFFFFTYDSLYFSFSVTFILVYMVYIFVCFPVFILFYFSYYISIIS